MNETTKVDPLATMDAKVWAEEFMRLFGDKRQEIDEGLMIAWFANAIMRGYDEGVRKHRNTFDQAREAIQGLLDIGKRDLTNPKYFVKFVMKKDSPSCRRKESDDERRTD